jgi:VWFA-related protein
LASATAIPDRFVLYLFDDIHGSLSDLAYTREAAWRHLQTSLRPNDRAAIMTGTGSVGIDFTSDRDKLHETLLAILPHRALVKECPDISYYMADQIDREVQEVIAVAMAEAAICSNLKSAQALETLVRNTARRVRALGDEDALLTLEALDTAVRKLAVAPGTRLLVVASPGYLRVGDKFPRQVAVIERAIRSHIVIGTVDSRGLTSGRPDASVQGEYGSSPVFAARQRYDSIARLNETGALEDLAASTGGAWIHNTNDLEGGFNRAASAPDAWYVLGFAPQNLKADGSYHELKVALTSGKSMTVEARHGYFAPTHFESAEEQARSDISRAIFSHDEVAEIPVTLKTEFFKTGESEAMLDVIARIDISGLRYRKENDRNTDQLRVAFSLFDRNGNLIEGAARRVEMRLRDETLARAAVPGIPVRVNFRVPPGGYFVRLVVRDDEGQKIASRNGSVEIP